jgi:membrane protease YdiL (CAAX protease family)
MSAKVSIESGKGPWGPLATALFTVLVAAFFTVAQTVIAIPYLILKVARSPHTDILGAARALQTDGLFFSAPELLGGVAALGVTILIIWLRRGPSLREYLALRPVKRLTVLWWLLWTVLFGVLLDGIAYLAGYTEGPSWLLDIYQSASFLPLLLFSIVVVAPVLEEAVFRGFLFEGIRHSWLGDVGAILLASSVWASVHTQYEWFYVGQVFAFGLLLSAARLRTGSLIPPILMHALFSGVAMLQVALFLPASNTSTPQSRPLPRNAPLFSDRKDETATRMAWGRKHVLLSYDQVDLKDPQWDDSA